MFRRTASVLAFSFLTFACGDDPDPKPASDASQADAGNSDAGSDTGVAPTPDVVTNAGAACRGANGCMGSGPTCQTMISLLGQEIQFPGGYCTTSCKNNIECGAAGECPVGESLKALTSIPFITADIRTLIETQAPSQCYERCTKDSDCRTDDEYRCVSILTALTDGASQAGLNIGGLDISTFLSGPIRDSKYCLPPAPELPDTGVPDAAVGDAAVGDAAVGDAAVGDAAVGDAAVGDGGASDAGASDGQAG